MLGDTVLAVDVTVVDVAVGVDGTVVVVAAALPAVLPAPTAPASGPLSGPSRAAVRRGTTADCCVPPAPVLTHRG